MRSKNVLLFSLSLFFLLVTHSFAQLSTGNLTGTVVDEDGSPLPGVAVTITSPQFILPQQSVVSTVSGFFRFNFLPPGKYKLTCELEGFSTVVQEDIPVKLGLTMNISIVMKAERIEETVTVTAEAPMVATENTKFSTNIESGELANLPVFRDLEAIVELVPGVSKGLVYPGAAGASLGAGQRENAFSIDGVNVTDAGSGILKTYQSLDSYDEIQVETAGHKAEFGNAGGAIINVVTKSGGNSFSGDFSFYFRNNKLQATNHEGTGLDEPSTETLYHYDANASLGGPIIKDKIWLYVSARINPTKQRTFGFPEERPFSRFYPLAKFTLLPHPKHRISLGYNYNRGHEPYFQGSAFVEPDACFDTYYRAHTALLNWLYTINSNTMLEVRGAYIYNPNEYLSRTQDVWIYDLATGEMSNSRNSMFQKRNRWQFQASLTHYVSDFFGDHEFKGGFEFERSQSNNTTEWYPDQYGMSAYYTQFGIPFMAVKYEPALSNPSIIRYYQYSGYIQDTWRINNYITANFGLRYGYLDSQVPPQENVPSKISVTNWKNLEPRLGVGIDPFGDGKTALKFSYSRYGMMMYTWFYGVNPNSQASSGYLVLSPGNFLLLWRSSPSDYLIDSDLKRPYSDEFFVNVERQLSMNWAIKVGFLYKIYRKFVTTDNAYYSPDWYVPITINNPVTNATMTIYDLKPDAPVDTLTLYTNNPEAKRDYKAFILGLEKRMSGNLFMRLSYTWSRSKGTVAQSFWESSGVFASGSWSNPNYLINRYGISELDRTHTIKFQGIYLAPYGFMVSLNYLGASGLPYTRNFNVTLSRGSENILAEPSGSNRLSFTHYVDLRIQKDFRISNFNLSLFLDVFNLLNANTETSIYTLYGSPMYLQFLSIQDARLAQIGFRFKF